MSYTYVLCRATGEPVGELLEARERRCTWQRNGIHSADVTLSLEDDLAAFLAPGLARLKVYRSPSAAELAVNPAASRSLVFYGSLPAAGMREQASNGIVSASFRDPRWVLGQRWTIAADTFTATDTGTILWTLLNAQNGRTGGDTWIRQGGTTTGVLRDWSTDRRRLLDLMDEATRGLDGVDVDVDPRDGFSETTPSRIMGNLRVYARQGAAKDTVHFLYGQGYPANCADMSRSYMDVITQATMTGSGSGTTDLASTYTDAGSSLYGLLEDYASDPDLATQATLDVKVRGRVEQRKLPRMVVEIVEPTPEAPQPWEHYYLGDTIYASCRKGWMDFSNLPLRVDAIDLTISDTGRESVRLTTSDPGLSQEAL